jgi:UDP-N-acetylglucosamine 4-epimerase
MTAYERASIALKGAPKRWLVTGAAGFIGSSLVESLLAAGQTVVGLDNFSSGNRENCQATSPSEDATKGSRFALLEGDIRSLDACHEACQGVDYVLHQAAQISVPASIANPLETHGANVTGFLNLLLAAQQQRVERVIYASSCAVYGESTQLPLTEDQPGQPLSPYATSKLANELYAAQFCRSSGLTAVGLRYFNVFGPRQNPRGAYAAVIPMWVCAMMDNAAIRIFGDGSSTRDFCYLANVVQANLLAATAPLGTARHEVVNVAVGSRTSLNELFETLRSSLLPDFPHLRDYKPEYEDFRPGDIRHSQADISKARRLLGYVPTHTVEQGLRETLRWYRQQRARFSSSP